MELGRLRETVIIEREQRSPDGAGGWTTSWQIMATRRAEVLGQRGDETMRIVIERSVARWRIIMRAFPTLSPKDRLIWKKSDGDVRMDIILVVPDTEHRGMVIVTGESGLS